MILIIAHHYVVNSGIQELYDFSDINGNMLFLQFFGFAGKIGINCFLLITGYFMCQQKVRLVKFLKLYLEIKFYKLVFYLIFLAIGLETLNLESFISNVFNLAFNQGSSSFTAVFIGLFLLSPFINLGIKNLNERQLVTLISVLLILHTVSSTFFFASTENLGWYITVYLIGSYIRLYHKTFFEKRMLWPLLTLGFIILAWISIGVVDLIGPMVGFETFYHMVIGSDKLLAIAIAITLFFCFKNLKLGYHKFVNTLATTTFGVLLIHADSDAMRTFLWKMVFRVPEQYWKPLPDLIFHAICTVLIVYVICVIIDLMRICLFEKPFFCWWFRKNPEIVERTLYKGLMTDF